MSKFIVLTQQRSGSTWFIDMLNNHPNCKAYSEPFVVSGREDNSKLLDEMGLIYKPTFSTFKKTTEQRRPFVTFNYLRTLDTEFNKYKSGGFKMMHSQIKDLSEVLIWILTKRYKIIRLERKNNFQKVMSNRIRKETQTAHIKADKERIRREVYIEPKTIVKDIKYQETQSRRLDFISNILPVPSLKITYENLKKDTHTTMNNVARFLKLPTQNTWKTDLKASNKKQIEVKNYNNIVRKIKNSDYIDSQKYFS